MARTVRPHGVVTLWSISTMIAMSTIVRPLFGVVIVLGVIVMFSDSVLYTRGTNSQTLHAALWHQSRSIVLLENK